MSVARIGGCALIAIAVALVAPGSTTQADQLQVLPPGVAASAVRALEPGSLVVLWPSLAFLEDERLETAPLLCRVREARAVLRPASPGEAPPSPQAPSLGAIEAGPPLEAEVELDVRILARLLPREREDPDPPEAAEPPTASAGPEAEPPHPDSIAAREALVRAALARGRWYPAGPEASDRRRVDLAYVYAPDRAVPGRFAVLGLRLRLACEVAAETIDVPPELLARVR